MDISPSGSMSLKSFRRAAFTCVSINMPINAKHNNHDLMLECAIVMNLNRRTRVYIGPMLGFKKVINYGTRILFVHVNAFAKCQ